MTATVPRSETTPSAVGSSLDALFAPRGIAVVVAGTGIRLFGPDTSGFLVPMPA